MAHFPRRKFLKTIGGAAVASALPNVVLGAQRQPPLIAIFWEPGFPASQDCGVTREILLEALGDVAPSFLNEQELIDQIIFKHFELLITPYGSAFPKRAWGQILKYLRMGGSWLNLGGIPLSQPVRRTAGGWWAESHQTTYHKALGITHSFPVQTTDIITYEATNELKSGLRPQEIYELYVRLSSSNNEPDEAGSDGPREGIVRPLVLGMNRDRRPIAAPVIQIDRLLTSFAGGRWVFANFRGSLDSGALRVLAEKALQGASRLEVRTDFACYQPGETPFVSIQLARPKGDLFRVTLTDYSLELRDINDRIVSRSNVALHPEAFTRDLELPSNLAPGLYKLHARTTLNDVELTHTNGFWIYDQALMSQGKPLTADNHFFYRDGKVFPVTGTTYMASDVHRRFLLDPNPFVWDNDFRAMKDAGVNMVRTGIWTGWKKCMTDAGKLNETALRAFDAFLLTAHKYDIPVIFTFFAFLPETWGGENAYLDPRSIKAQQQFISAFAQRCAHIDDVIWDFINEPSFGSYKYIWSCRPNYDAHEQAAWKQWLRERYPAASDEEHVSQMPTTLAHHRRHFGSPEASGF